MSTPSEDAYAAMLARLPEQTNEPTNCRHESFATSVSVARLLDTGRFIAEVRIVCVQCREPFRFLGMEAGLRNAMPACSIDGLEANLPIEPEVQKRLFPSARYEMPPAPEPRH